MLVQLQVVLVGLKQLLPIRKVVQVLKQVTELAPVKALPGGDPLDPPFRCTELHPVYIMVESANKVHCAN